MDDDIYDEYYDATDGERVDDGCGSGESVEVRNKQDVERNDNSSQIGKKRF
jgi:hypothetical protein